MKRFFPFLLICALVLGMIPTTLAAEVQSEATALTQEDYITADLMWDAVNAKEAELRSKRAPLRQTVEAIVSVVTESPYYAEDSLIRNGDHLFWETKDGIPCGYSPRLAEIGRNATAIPAYDIASAQTTITTSYEKKAGMPGSKDVYVIQPYYGIDSNFTDQYEKEAEQIAFATKGASTIYRTTGATVDNIANAIESGGVVIFDSHGDTDYILGEDYTSQANTSYICLQTNAGLTAEDYDPAMGQFGEYYHAFYGGSYGTMRYYCVDGTVIANHMDKKADCSMLWMALCLGMATDGLHAPLIKKGVEVAYGYSQSVTFDYDYLWEEVFWLEMKLGKSVADAIATMKDQIGLWDWCHASGYDTIEEARAEYCAFPIVVSPQDIYPGHGKVDDLQTVYSAWTLVAPCKHERITAVAHVPATCTEEGNLSYYICDDCNAVFRDQGLRERITIDVTVLSPIGHSYNSGVITTAPTCTEDGVKTFTCCNCGDSYTETLLSPGHNYEDGFCTHCGKEKPNAEEFAPGHSGMYVLAAYANGSYYVMPNNYTDKSGKLSGVKLQITDGFVEEEFATEYAVALTYDAETGGYTIHNGTYYLKYPSSTNIVGSTSPYYWTIARGRNGSWRITSETANRILAYRASGYHTFGSYYAANVTAGDREYFDIEIIPVSASVPGEEAPEWIPQEDESIVINHSLNLASDISINYAVLSSYLDGYDSFELRCRIPNYKDDGSIEYRTEIIEPVLKDYFYYFTLTGVTAVQMGDSIQGTLHMTKEGKEYFSKTDVYSVSDYAYGQLAKEDSSQALKKLCAELLRYGSYAQQYKGYRIHALVDAALTEEHKAYFTDLETVIFHRNNEVLEDLPDPTVTWAGKTLDLGSKVVVKFVANLCNYEGDPKELSLKVSYENYKGEAVELVIPEAQLYMEELHYYAFELESLLAAELRTVVSASVWRGDTQVSPTVRYSADSYAIGKTGTLLTLCKTLMSYSDTALAYFTKQ